MIRPDRVHSAVVDINTLLERRYRLPLRACAAVGGLLVYWSPQLARQLAKVVYRQHVLSMLRTGEPKTRSAGTVRQLFEQVSELLEDHVADLEQHFRYAENLDAIDDALLDIIRDPGDRSVLRAALAADASFIFSLDRRHLPHGAIFHGVQCWHPDTFLTLFFQQNLDVYERAVEQVLTAPPGVRRRRLPPPR